MNAATDTKPYDGGTGSSATGTIAGGGAALIVAGDTAPTWTEQYLDKNAAGPGGSMLRASGIMNDGNGGNNYQVQFMDTPGTINKITLTTTADDKTIPQGDTVPAGTVSSYNYVGFVGGDGPSVISNPSPSVTSGQTGTPLANTYNNNYNITGPITATNYNVTLNPGM